MRHVKASVVAFCISLGIALAKYATEARPVGYLTRPMIALAITSVLIGVVTGLFRVSVIGSAVASAWLLKPGGVVAVVLSLVAAVMIAYRLVKSKPLDLDAVLVVAAGTFLVAGVIPVLPMITWTSSQRLGSDTGKSEFLILLDGYPRADTLASLGIDISPFLDGLETRGFQVYSDATSHHAWTYRTLTSMFTGEPMTNDDFGTPSERRQARSHWQLPQGFVTIAPPAGMVTIPKVPVLNPGGPTLFEAELLRDSLLAPVSAKWVMDGWRYQLGRSLEILGSTREARVFAHLLAPHTPFLYDSDGRPLPPPDCWPVCGPMEVQTRALGISVDEWAGELGEYLDWLNPKLIQTVDRIIGNHPSADIILFSDHGGRYAAQNAEWHRTFLAARTDPPGILAESPHPDSIMNALGS